MIWPTVISAQPGGLTVLITDQSGGRISSAIVSLSSGEGQTERVTADSEGRAVFSRSPVPGQQLFVQAKGFAEFRTVFTESTVPELVFPVVLLPGPLTEQVVVSPNRNETRLDDTAASVIVLNSRRLSETAALPLDDALRQVPGFALFRRSGSRTANPTAQGVSLRGTGASGASRALVLSDGIPLNDPFGGWVYWNRVPRESINRVEVLRGGASDLYGSGAIGGLVNVVIREAGTSPAVSISLSGGSMSTFDGSIFAAGTWNGWSASASGAEFQTGGYIPVAEDERGTIDSVAASRNAPLSFTLSRPVGADGRIFGRAGVYGESRRNGTPLQINRTHLRSFAGGAEWISRSAGSFVARAYGGTQVFDQTFTAVNAARTAETITRLQRSPSQHLGFSFQWSRALGERQALIAGFEGRNVRGSSDEIAYTNGSPTAMIGAGGRETTYGAYLQDVFQINSRITITMGFRFDRRRNYRGLNATSPLISAGANSLAIFSDRDETAFSPRASILFKISPNVSLNASIGRAFRAPTLNELYRSFRVGNVLTLANEDLLAERATGGEAGVSLARFNQRLFVRGNVFWTEVTRPVANVTLATTPNLITRQRRNLGRTRSAGVELDAELRLNRYWTFSTGYLYARATVVEYPGVPSLVGLWIPQVARNQFTFQTSYHPALSWTISVQGRVNGQQFDDDQNLFRLEPFFALDVIAAHRITRRWEVFAAGENLTNQRYSIGRTPVRTVAAPISARIGLRFNWRK